MKRTECSRLGIFNCYDPDGIIDDYIPFLLNDFKENISRLIIVVNGRLTPEAVSYTHLDVYKRQSHGSGAAAQFPPEQILAGRRRIFLPAGLA